MRTPARACLDRVMRKNILVCLIFFASASSFPVLHQASQPGHGGWTMSGETWGSRVHGLAFSQGVGTEI